jgi:hypothetical protein
VCARISVFHICNYALFASAFWPAVHTHKYTLSIQFAVAARARHLMKCCLISSLSSWRTRVGVKRVPSVGTVYAHNVLINDKCVGKLAVSG